VLECIGVDLTVHAERHALMQRIDAAGGNVLVLTEGILPYLSEVVVAALADELRQVESVREWIVDYIAPAVAKARMQMSAGGAHALPLVFSPDDWVAFFSAHRFEVAERRSLIYEGAANGRPFPMPSEPTNAPNDNTAKTVTDLFGYARLVPA